MNNIRNFAIIAHVDHGKSTLADRFLEITGMVKPGEHVEQLLDRNPISRERGITIKLAPVRMLYRLTSSRVNELENNISQPVNALTNKQNNDFFILNLIDTPGHVDFSYEVERTLGCVEGVILLVDASCGIQAQTVVNAQKALEQNLVIIPAINKIDLPAAQISETKKQMVEFLEVEEADIHEVSAKTGQNVEKLLQAVIEKIPPPVVATHFNSSKARAIHESPLQCLIFDSYYDQYRGVVLFARVFNGELKSGMKAYLHGTKTELEILEVGIFTPDLKSKENLKSGEIGYLVTNLKDIHEVSIGDTIVDKIDTSPLPGYRKIKPMVFASIFPVDTNDYLHLKKALEQLYLSDSSLEFKLTYSKALGSGFRVGFLGLLHADVVRERLEREYGLNLILTPPQVKFLEKERQFFEPILKIKVITASIYLNDVMRLCQNYRGKFITMDGKSQIVLIYHMPMSEMIFNFFDKLKSVSSGYASLDWEFLRHEKVEADMMTILLNGNEVDEFCEIVVKERIRQRANYLAKRLRELIPRQQYEVKIQVKYKGKIITSERIAPFRKDVTQKLYGGDRTRKDKLLEKQKKGKKTMKNIGRVEIPKEAFLKLFKLRY